ncbi:hypothetical protein F511_30021 [Dorcoceras hygrometricum]|uniref:mannan endo-1,4-beta-mannosidase n=1 Tax=Dorcoceras hygrometricum TaxID=472368 RepID=A0A2Z7CVX5_9LAMI|nr:hypothetical protein F511_30021 [Dorcoceras hygrometricum]
MGLWGSIFLALFLIFERKIYCKVSAKDGFISTEGVHFMLNGAPFYANGFNAYWLMYVASDKSQRGKISSAFEEAADHGLTIARTWAFGDGGYFSLQYSPGSYNEQMFQARAVLTRQNSITGISYRDDPTIMAWELMNEPRCTTDESGRIIQAWISEMASYLKSIDTNHLLEAGLEGFYGPSDEHKKQINPNFQVGTDFISNNQIPHIDFATVHSYPDQWLTGESDEAQFSFLNNWVASHIRDAQDILHKPLLFAEFGKSSRDPGYNINKRDELLSIVYSAIYSSASGGGAAAGGLFWQLLTEGMDNFRDGYEIVFNESPSTDDVIVEQSRKLNKIRKMYARMSALAQCKME